MKLSEFGKAGNSFQVGNYGYTREYLHIWHWAVVGKQNRNRVYYNRVYYRVYCTLYYIEYFIFIFLSLTDLNCQAIISATESFSRKLATAKMSC